MPYNPSTGLFTRSSGINTGATVWADEASGDFSAARFDVHDQDIADALSNCVTRDGVGKFSADSDLQGNKFTNVGAATAISHVARVAELQQSKYMSADTLPASVADAYQLVFDIDLLQYQEGEFFTFVPNADNTGATTVKIDLLATVALKGPEGNELLAKDLRASRVALMQYRGGEFRLLNPQRYSKGRTSFTPTFGANGSMTFNGVTVNHAVYERVTESLVWVSVSVDGTIGGTPSTYITVSAPIASTGPDNQGFGCYISDITTQEGGFVDFRSGPGEFRIFRSDRANWTAGAGKSAIFTGVYAI